MTYRFIVSRARSLTTCPTVHLVSCSNAKRISRPVRAFWAEGQNAMAALHDWQVAHSTTPMEPCRNCLGEQGTVMTTACPECGQTVGITTYANRYRERRRVIVEHAPIEFPNSVCPGSWVKVAS